MIEFRLPSLGADMDEGKLLEWLVKPGDMVKKGQIVCVVDTAKAAIDVECWHDGLVHALLTEPGTRIPVGTLMAVLREANESAAQVEDLLAALKAKEVAPKVSAPLPTVPHVVTAASVAAARQRVSPAARRRAEELHVNLAQVTGSGPDGAITILDVEAVARAPTPAAMAPAPAPPTTRAEEMRKVIAAAMARSKREIPHYYLAEDVPLERATAWLMAQNAGRNITERLLMAPLLLKAVASALERTPELNGFWRNGAFEPGAGIHLGVAISLRAGGGLVAPALHNVPRKDIDTLTRELLDLVKRTRAGSLKSSELSDATITVTNLGDEGVAAVFGVIYPPQVALVGFGRVTERPWIVDGEIRAIPVVTASLAADHRVSDGHRGGLFLAALHDALQDPEQLAKGRP
jgi:pyruvate dehydrogenase E2 component (dihydrolipoamide acetyltransferase)